MGYLWTNYLTDPKQPSSAEQPVKHIVVVSISIALALRPERISKHWQKAPLLADPYLSVGADQSAPLFVVSSSTS
ncbi:hypothetical protein [Metabacillus idriensis]|uniref:hypothetical protein n=1 Tax=Metabacillus idriensis TaxID=324768 RepID=UPI003D2C8C59